LYAMPSTRRSPIAGNGKLVVVERLLSLSLVLLMP